MNREELIKAIEQNGSQSAVLLRQVMDVIESEISDVLGNINIALANILGTEV